MIVEQRTAALLENLPPLVACVIWDIVNNNLSLQTIQLANLANEAEWQQYDIVRCVAAANPHRLPIKEAQALVETMLEKAIFPIR